MNNIILVSTILLSLLLSGCALNAGFRFGDDGSVSKPEVHGGVNASGTRSL